MKRFLCALAGCLCLLLPLMAQSNKLIKELESKRGALQKQIAESETLLQSTKKDVKSQLGNLALLSGQIEERQKYIQTIENDDDRDFMEWLFLEYHPLMYATIRKVIHDQWTCEDVLQESVRKFIDHIPQLREMDAASRTNYIVVACRYNAIEEEKRQRRAPFPAGNGVIDIASRDAENPERQILLLDDADVLWRVWPQLDSRTRQLLEDKYVLNMSDAEIASALGVKPSSVRMLLTRARSKARKAIEKKM